ncbi:ATP-binding protein [Streptomyces huiliensis]|uniref:ATP-binding protein n=1 Tax=Streptomyces huiliensis TaxID=2876027 RepID=UPI001CBC165F|nr:ATP-binding protein [Streptomyces huiliensis]
MISRVNKHCTVELQALPQRIRQVRRIVSAQLRYWHLDPLIDPAALGVTELLTNVHQHAEPDKRCTVEISLMLDRLTVSVRDHDPRLPRVGAPDETSTHGRGLALVAALSSGWGVQPCPEGGKAVWFTLLVPASAPAADPWRDRGAEPAVTFERATASLTSLGTAAFTEPAALHPAGAGAVPAVARERSPV